MRVFNFSGTPAQIGEAFGETLRDEIAEFYRRRVDNALGQAKKYGDRNVTEAQLLGIARASLPITEAYDPAGFAELTGVARGSGLDPAQILAMNGLTDFRDVLAWHGELETFGGCTSFMVQRDMTAGGKVMCGQTWDLATDNMPYVIGVHRQPDGQPETWTLTTVGCLSLIGMNEHGIAVGTTNVRTHDAKQGVTYLSIIHKILDQRTFDDAVSAVRSADRAGAHYYYLASAEGRVAGMETTARSFDIHEVQDGIYVHTNHCLVPQHAEIEADTPHASSHARQGRMEELLEGGRGKLDMEALEGFMGDRANGENAILRDDYNGISSNGAVVMSPEDGLIHACHGLPGTVPWVDLKRAAADA